MVFQVRTTKKIIGNEPGSALAARELESFIATEYENPIALKIKITHDRRFCGMHYLGYWLKRE